jgi:hypothetical protein
MVHAKQFSLRSFWVASVLVLCGMMPLATRAQDGKQEFPLVLAGKMPLYPIMARAARVQGVVKLKVTTDGKKVASVDVESGPPMLVKFAKENILTWEFTVHKPTTFVTTFEYIIEEPAQCDYSNDALTLKLPLEVRIIVKGLKTCDPSAEIKSHP